MHAINAQQASFLSEIIHGYVFLKLVYTFNPTGHLLSLLDPCGAKDRTGTALQHASVFITKTFFLS